ncbi:recombinase family protein [Aminipila butyrica]|uniref:Recombinase family protein n=1 Tax=Aminipila butyrica TaxID=433296 RepID=A0A858BWP6_9FIRM|nr:recombinase family protein [Aminipila butyrica]QIB69505.1 recombinase family protein [Aminipila butyrica]
MTIIAVGYSRLSKEDVNKQGWDNDSESIKNQHYLIRDYAEKKGWQLVEIYSDDDYKGSDRSRPEFNRLISDMYAHKFQVIICKTQSRFARDIELIEKYIHGVFMEENIRFVTIEDHIDTANMNSSSKKISQLHGLTDTWYLEDLSHNISDVLDIKRKKGEYIASWPLYGYLKSPDDKNRLIVDPVAAEVVRSIYQMYLAGNGLQRIANSLNQRSIPNPLKYKRDAGMKIGAKSRMTSKSFLWRNDTIGRILDNQMYIGDMVQGKLKKVSYKSKKLVRQPEEEWIIAESKHPPIIDRNTWERVRSIRKSRIKPRRDGIVSMFSGKIRCLECKELMYAVTYPRQINGRKSKTEFNTTFRCSKKMMNKEACPATGISMASLEKYIIDELKKLSELYFDECIIQDQLTVTDGRQETLEGMKQEEFRLKRLLEENKLAVTTLYLDKVKGLLMEKQFVQISEQLAESGRIAESALKKVMREREGLSREQSKEENLMEIILKYKDIERLDRNIVLELIDIIYVGKEDRKKNQRVIQIAWNF